MKYRVIKYPPSEFACSVINEKNISREWKYLPSYNAIF